MKEPSLGMTQNGHDFEDTQGLGTLLLAPFRIII